METNDKHKLNLQAKSTLLSKQNEKLVAAFFYGVIGELEKAELMKS